MKTYKITFANGATETVEARTADEATALRVYTKHRVTGIRVLGELKASQSTDIFFL